MLSAGPPKRYTRLEVRSMSRAQKRGPGPSHVLMTPDHAGNVVGIDPHKRTLTATIADARGGILSSAHFRVSGEGHRELEAWARQFGPIARWGIEGAASWGRHTAMFLTGRGHDAPTRLRLQLLDGYRAQIKTLDLEEKQVVAHLEALVGQSGSTLGELCGLSTRSVAELLVEVGDPRRFTEGGFARFNGSAPLPASTAEGPGEPVRHRYNPGGNRRINAILYRMAVTQLRCEPRAQRIYENARAGGHTKKEARRILKRHLSDVIYRRMIRDQATRSAQPLLAA